jgi:hypothetical protein
MRLKKMIYYYIIYIYNIIMRFLIDDNLKIVFGWSAKSGCSHIKKIFWYLKTNNENFKIHTTKENNSLPTDIQDYRVILIIRNPYERVISGFLDKYRPNGVFRKLWKNKELSFINFVDEIVKNNWSVIDNHHFTPQTTEKFDEKIILKAKELKIFDIKNIDYTYIEDLYNKKITDNLLNFRGGHERKATTPYENDVYDLDMKTYYEYNVNIKYFYNEDIKNKIYEFYKNDFTLFKKLGFDYTNSL